MTVRIVVIDNDVDARDSLTTSLGKQGWQVVGYVYAQIDLASLEQLHPDLIILDLNIQDGGIGWALLQALKMEDATSAVPILITTTILDLPAEIKGYLLTRYIHVVYKPVDLDVFLPLVQKTLTSASQADSIFSSDHLLPILVVEDSEELRDALTTILQMEGYQAVGVENGLLALDALYRADHCLILLDMRMPIMDGIEFLRVYDLQRRPHTPVIVLSAEATLLTRDFPAFVIDVIAKPYSFPQLLPIVRKYALLG